MSPGWRIAVIALQLAAIVVGILLMVTNYSGRLQNDQNTTNELLNDIEEQSTTSDEDSSKPTPRQIYDQVQNGMTPEQVKAIAQRDPDSQTESDIEGLGKTQYWSFNRGSGFVSITFTNGAVSNKSIYE